MTRKQTAVPDFQINFVGPSGEITGCLLLASSASKGGRKLDHTAWDATKSIRRFLWYLARSDGEGLDISVKALLHLGCLDQALRQCLKGHRPNLKKLSNLLLLWNNYGFCSIPRALKDELFLFTDAVRHFAPPYTGNGLTLYRGQESGEPYGIAWTSRYEMAAGQFSAGRTVPVVLTVCASPEMIVVHVPDHISTPKTNPESDIDYEDEYLLDPRQIAGKVKLVGGP